MEKNDIVQFPKSHKWAGCIGVVDSVKNGIAIVCVRDPEFREYYIRVFTDDVYVVGKYYEEEE